MTSKVPCHKEINKFFKNFFILNWDVLYAGVSSDAKYLFAINDIISALKGKPGPEGCFVPCLVPLSQITEGKERLGTQLGILRC